MGDFPFFLCPSIYRFSSTQHIKLTGKKLNILLKKSSLGLSFKATIGLKPPVWMDLSPWSIHGFVSVLSCDIVYSVGLLNGYSHFPLSWKAGTSMSHFHILPSPLLHQALSRNPLIKGPGHVHLPCLCQHPHLLPPQPTGRKPREELSSFRECWWPSIFPTSQLERCSISPSHRPGHKGWGIHSRRAPVIMHLCMKQQPLHHF